MSEPVVQPTKTPVKHVPYINNPFFIATEGLRLFFTKAVGIAVLLIIVSAFFHVNAITTPSEPAGQSSSSSINIQGGSNRVEIPGDAAAVIIVLAVMVGAGVVVALIAAGTILTGISGYSSAQIANGKEALLKDAWKATLDQFWSLLWLQVLTVLKILAWTLLFVIPGIVMAFRYSLATTAFFDKKLKGNAAIKESLALTKGSWITLFGAQTVFGVITLGTINSLVSASTTAILYRQFRTTPLEKRPKAHGLSIAAFVLSIIALVVGVIAAVALVVISTIHNGIVVPQ